MKCSHCKSDNVIGYTDLIKNSYRCVNCKKVWDIEEELLKPKDDYDKSDYQVLYDFALDFYDHPETARVKVEAYLKNKNNGK